MMYNIVETMTEHILVHMIQLMQKYTQHNIKKHLQASIQKHTKVYLQATTLNNIQDNIQKHM